MQDEGLICEIIDGIVEVLDQAEINKRQLYANAAKAGFDKRALSIAVQEIRKARKERGYNPMSYGVTSSLALQYIEAYAGERTASEDAFHAHAREGAHTHAHARETTDMHPDPQTGVWEIGAANG